MRKYLLTLIASFISLAGNAAVTKITCVSNDFNSSSATGSKLYLKLDNGQLVSATLARGSWGCDGYDRAPKKVAKTEKGTIYSVNFGTSCDGFSYNSRIFVPTSSEVPQWVAYNFTYLTDDTPGKLKAVLSCK